METLLKSCVEYSSFSRKQDEGQEERLIFNKKDPELIDLVMITPKKSGFRKSISLGQKRKVRPFSAMTRREQPSLLKLEFKEESKCLVKP